MDRPCVKVKVCGLTRVEEAVECALAGADWIGLNFHPPSPRHVTPSLAREIIAAIPLPTRAVGLFVNRAANEVADLATDLGLEIIQLHGDEPPEDFRILDRFTVIRAFRIAGPEDLNGVESYLRAASDFGRVPDALLIDAFVPGRPGGTGTEIPDRLPDALPGHQRLILAGGLSPRNVGRRIARVRPWMVDVASGVEASPGRKDLTLVKAFIDAARSVPFTRGSGNPVP